MMALRLLVLAAAAVLLAALIVNLGQRDEVDWSAFDGAEWRAGEDRWEGTRLLLACRPYRGRDRAFVERQLGRGSVDGQSLTYQGGEDSSGWDRVLVAEFNRRWRLVGYSVYD